MTYSGILYQTVISSFYFYEPLLFQISTYAFPVYYYFYSQQLRR